MRYTSFALNIVLRNLVQDTNFLLYFFNKDPDQPFISEGANLIQINRFCNRNKVQLRTNDWWNNSKQFNEGWSIPKNF